VAALRTALTSRSPRQQGGFTLVEVLVSLLVLLVVTAVAAQLLTESAQTFADIAGEQLDPIVPTALNLIRADVEQASSVVPSAAAPLPCGVLVALGGPLGTVSYTFDGKTLRRTVIDAAGKVLWDTTLLRQVTNWTCQAQVSATGAVVVQLSLTYNRRALCHTPLTVLPAYQGSFVTSRTESFFVTLRGGGLGTTW
jgi:prepilin-type N-terminal cleavage/methylation domain-containing protein